MDTKDIDQLTQETRNKIERIGYESQENLKEAMQFKDIKPGMIAMMRIDVSRNLPRSTEGSYQFELVLIRESAMNREITYKTLTYGFSKFIKTGDIVVLEPTPTILHAPEFMPNDSCEFYAQFPSKHGIYYVAPEIVRIFMDAYMQKKKEYYDTRRFEIKSELGVINNQTHEMDEAQKAITLLLAKTTEQKV